MFIPIEINSFALIGNNTIPAIIFRECGGKRTFVVPVDAYEASAIALATLTKGTAGAIENHSASILIRQLGATLEKTVFFACEGQKIKAGLHLLQQKKTIVVHCKPSDAILCALLLGAPMLAKEDVAFQDDSEDGGTVCKKMVLSEGEKIRQTIYNTDTTEFGRFYPE